MKDVIKAAAEIGKTAVLDGSVNAADLRHNKKKVAVTLAKAVAWQLVQRHPLFVAIKFGLIAFGFLIAFGIGLAIYLAF